MDQSRDTSEVLPYPLVGLGHAISPSQAYFNLTSGHVPGLPEVQIQKSLRTAAISIHSHQELSQRYKSRVYGSRYSIPYLVSALHGSGAPAPPRRLNSRDLSRGPLLELRHWESLYYAIVVEVRELYADIQKHFETELEHGRFILHMFGSDGTESTKVFPILDFATQLEEIWLLCMDSRIMGPLEMAVRMNNFPCDGAEGMLDAAAVRTEEITARIWQLHAPLLRRTCLMIFNIDIDGSQEHVRSGSVPVHVTSTVRPPEGQAGEYMSTSPLELGRTCSCLAECPCRLVCQFEISTATCACKTQSGLSRVPGVTSPQTALDKHGHNRADLAPVASGHSATIVNDMARMRLNTMPLHEANTHWPRLNSSEGSSRSFDVGRPSRRRDRANTNASELAYVPNPRTHLRGRKENFPLGLYGPNEGRYPTFRSNTEVSSPSITGPVVEFPPIPDQKLVAGSFSSANTPYSADGTLSSSMAYTDTNPSSSPEAVSLTANITGSEGAQVDIKNVVTQSSPVSGSKNPRCTDDEFAVWDTSHLRNPMSQAISKADAIKSPSQLRSPFVRRSPDCPSPGRTERLSPTSLLVEQHHLKQLAEGLPAIPTAPSRLPTPDFIAPRPALKQRYFSAGGNAKLEDREELVGFALPKANKPIHFLDQRNFFEQSGDPAFMTPRRDSGAIIGKPGTKQTPSSSGASRLKQIFRRHNSSPDGDVPQK